MSNLSRRLLYLAAVALLGIYGFFTLKGPQGIPGLIARHNQIRQLEAANADLARENESKRKRIQELERNDEKIKLEIRDKTKKILPGEIEFVLPETPKPAPAPSR